MRLFLNSIDYGSVYNNSFVEFEYCDELDGIVNATLIGYQYGIPITFHTRYFKFAKVELEVEEMLDSGTEFIGEVLYLILHDPVGDHSFSGFEKSHEKLRVPAVAELFERMLHDRTGDFRSGNGA